MLALLIIKYTWVYRVTESITVITHKATFGADRAVIDHLRWYGKIGVVIDSVRLWPAPPESLTSVHDQYAYIKPTRGNLHAFRDLAVHTRL